MGAVVIDIKDVAGLSQPITPLIEVVSAGVGAISAPYLLKKNADAQAYQIKTIANALGNRCGRLALGKLMLSTM